MRWRPEKTIVTLRHPDGYTENAIWFAGRYSVTWDPPEYTDQRLMRAKQVPVSYDYYGEEDTGNDITLFCRLRVLIPYCEVTGAKVVGVEMQDVFAGIVEAARDTLAVMRRRFPEHILAEDIVTRGEYTIDWPDPREAIV